MAALGDPPLATLEASLCRRKRAERAATVLGGSVTALAATAAGASTGGQDDFLRAAAQVPTQNLALFAHPFEFTEMLRAVLAVPAAISFTMWGFTDSDSRVPGFFKGEGYATIYDVNQNPKQAYFSLQSELAVAAHGTPHRVHTYTPRSRPRSARGRRARQP